MKKAIMANLDYTLMVRELQPIVGKFYDKFYEMDDGRFRLKFGRDNILVELPIRLHKTKYLEQAPEATAFAMKVRKELKGKLLTKLSQHKKDRVVVFDFDGTRIIAELFGKGNLVLERDGKILAVYSRESWKGRQLRANAEYKFPPSETKTLEEILSFQSENAIAAELRNLDIGMSYVRAMLEDAGVPDSLPANELSQEQKQAIASSHEKLLRHPERFSAFTKGKHFPTLSEALDDYYGPPEESNEEEEEKNAEIERLNALLESQESKLKELHQDEQEARQNAEFIYSHYGEIEQILDLYRKSGIEAVEKLAEKKGWTLNKKEKVLEL
jgi:predicted ribosome quality control (RQC) complex YloA/Tae2 family protein